MLSTPVEDLPPTQPHLAHTLSTTRSAPLNRYLTELNEPRTQQSRFVHLGLGHLPHTASHSRRCVSGGADRFRSLPTSRSGSDATSPLPRCSPTAGWPHNTLGQVSAPRCHLRQSALWSRPQLVGRQDGLGNSQHDHLSGACSRRDEMVARPRKTHGCLVRDRW